MNMNYDIIVTAILVIVGGIAVWFKGNEHLSKYAASFIAKAEELYSNTMNAKTGAEKKEWVINEIKEKLPFIPRNIIAETVQTIFDSIKEYAQIQLSKQTEKILSQAKNLDTLKPSRAKK